MKKLGSNCNISLAKLMKVLQIQLIKIVLQIQLIKILYTIMNSQVACAHLLRLF